jgi:NSS family neurotransmitter:Na+ symporter
MWWKLCLAAITPLVLGVMLFENVRTKLQTNYEDYPTEFLITYGWAAVAATLAVAVTLTLKGWNERVIALDADSDVRTEVNV